MAIRLPKVTVATATYANETGTSSVGGGIPLTFNLPQDIDNVLVKFSASVAGAGVSAQLQTTDDGGVTWYGNARTSIVSNAVGDNVQWLSVPVNGFGIGTSSIVAVGSVVAVGGIGSAQPSTLSSGEVTGLPILGQYGRVITQITGNVTSATSNSVTVQVQTNSQSATA